MDDKRELSGLARSIDALFTSGSRAGAPPSPEVGPDEPAPPPAELDAGSAAAEPLAAPSSPDDAEPIEPLALAEPSQPRVVEETGEPPVVEEPTEPPVAQDPSSLLPAPVLAVPTEDPAPLEGAEPDTEVDATFVLEEPSAPEESSAAGEGTSAPGPDELARAVERFLAGAQGAGADVLSLAEQLRDRLALDPVADAAERLVREAGEPPDPTLVDMAREIVNPAVASRIVQRIGHERDDGAKSEYRVLCQRLGDVMAKSFRGALTGATEPEARRTYYDILISMGDSSRPIIEGMLEDENTLLVRSGVAMVGEMGGENAVELVTSALANPDARVRREGLLALAKLGDEEAGSLVVGLLDDSERDVRVAAATAAGALKVERALRPLLKLLEEEGDGEGAVPFIDALGKLGDPGAVPAIEKHAVKSLFSKPSTEVRVAAYRALHLIGSPHARDLVQKALSDKEPVVRAAVRHIAASPPSR